MRLRRRSIRCSDESPALASIIPLTPASPMQLSLRSRYSSFERPPSPAPSTLQPSSPMPLLLRLRYLRSPTALKALHNRLQPFTPMLLWLRSSSSRAVQRTRPAATPSAANSSRPSHLKTRRLTPWLPDMTTTLVSSIGESSVPSLPSRILSSRSNMRRKTPLVEWSPSVLFCPSPASSLSSDLRQHKPLTHPSTPAAQHC
mmetsp:Transcript_4280/g.12322  ORF Transcript_4280/g.12322 Transcript_4280/m.12322 type:complete len:201 (-) Transcript_4280:4371-4973(-)